MARLSVSFAILLVVLPALIAASACRIAVSSRLTENQGRYNLYTGTITNVGSAAAANIALTPSDYVSSVSGLRESSNGYSLPRTQTQAGGIAVGASYTFTYQAGARKNVVWTASCTDGATQATSAPTVPAQAATQAPTVATTQKAATKAPTAKAATQAPSTAPTQKAATQAATAAPTAKAATQAATAAPTQKAATQAPTTKAATQAPTTKAATQAPTTKAATQAPSTGGKLCPAGTVWSPAPQTTWQWQLTGTVDTSLNVQMYDIDLFDLSASTVSTLHAQGKAVICYFSTQYENWRPDASSFTSAVLGNALDGWAGEKWVDIRSSVVRNIIAARLDLAVSKGCDGVEPDNVDSYSANTGFPLTASNQLDYNRFIANAAHARGLSVGLKNDLDQAAALEPSFDWILNEQCNEYSECGMLSSFTNKGKAAFNTEYSGSASSVCPQMATAKISSLIKDLDLGASIKAQCCTYQSNGCAAVPYSCKAVTSTRSVEGEENNVYAAQAVDTLELTQEVPAATANSATSSFASIAFVAVAAVAAMNL
jgi:hypothetical protein